MIIVHHLMKIEVGCLCSITSMKMKWNAQGKDIFVGHFISLVKGCVEKCMTGFIIDGRTIKRGKLVCLSVIKRHLGDLTLHALLGSSGS